MAAYAEEEKEEKEKEKNRQETIGERK